MTISLSGLDLSGIEWKPAPKRKRPARPDRRSSMPAPYVRADGMDATMNHADGRMYDSKSAYEKAVKRAGCEIVGNDSSHKNAKPKTYEPKGVGADIKRAIQEVGGA